MARIKDKERREETAQARTEGRNGISRQTLYAEAKRRNIPGRCKMNKAEVEHALEE